MTNFIYWLGWRYETFLKGSLGDKLIDIAVFLIVISFVVGWVILLASLALEKIFPKSENKIENFLQNVSKPIGFILKYSIIVLGTLFGLYFVAAILGWAP